MVEVTEDAWILAVPDGGGAGPVLVQLDDHLYDYSMAVEAGQDVRAVFPGTDGAVLIGECNSPRTRTQMLWLVGP